MKNIWNNITITDINTAVYVMPGTGSLIHTNRPFYGFSINDSESDKILTFKDGNVIRQRPFELCYFPKGSNYSIKQITYGGCWAINFDLLQDINLPPFSLMFRNYDDILKLFKSAVKEWDRNQDAAQLVIKKDLYEIIYKTQKELSKDYMPSAKQTLLSPAIDKINKDYTNPNISVKQLSALCNITEAYFRRLFINKFSVSPKEYIIHKRMELAKKLILSQQFTIGDISTICGYTEPCHFSREFRRNVGVSPTEFLKASQK